MQRLYSAIVAILFFAFSANGQNLEAIGKEKPIKVTGGVSLSQIAYGVSGIDSRRDPYSYFASGNLNISLYGFNVPLSFSLSNQNVSFQQPFNQLTLHPTYKWATAHIGFISMSYSPYTVSGHLFNGAAIDLAPQGKFKFSALYGRFLKAVEPDTLNKSVQPAFQRMGVGFKTSYGDGKDFAEITFFHAKDEINSIRYVPETQGILPQENLVMSIGAGKTFFNSLSLKAEIATSALSRDIRVAPGESSSPLAQASFLFTPRISTSYYNAIKSSLTYQGSGYSIGLGYERIDPQYRTLGAYFFNNDLENVTVNGATALFQGKVNIAASVGTQHDNLDNSKISTMKRFVGSANIAYAPTQKLNLSASYSNFQTFTNIRSQFVNINRLTPYENLDTLRFTQVSQNASVNAVYMMSSSQTKRQNLNVNFTVQDAADSQAGVPQNSGIQFYNANTAYSLSFVPQNMTLTASLNATINDGSSVRSQTWGPTVSLAKSFFEKKLKTTASFSMNDSFTNGQHLSSVSISRISATTTLYKKHNLNLGLVIVNRDNKIENAAKSFTEFTGTLGYSYSFGN
jgi:hypothetical protein